MDEDNDPISGELDKILQDFKDSEFLPKVAETQLEVADIKPEIVQANVEDIEQRIVDTKEGKLPEKMSNTWSVEVDGKRFEYMGEINSLNMYNGRMKGEYILTKYEVSEEKKRLLGLIPVGSRRKMVWSFKSNNFSTNYIINDDGRVYNLPDELGNGYSFTCRGGLYLAAMGKGFKPSQSLLDNVFLPMELELKKIFQQSQA